MSASSSRERDRIHRARQHGPAHGVESLPQGVRASSVHDINPAPVRALEALGARAARDAAGVAAASDVVFTMLPNSAIVEEVVAGVPTACWQPPAGASIVDMSTIDPLVTDRLAAAAAQRGHRVRRRAGRPAGEPCRARRVAVHGRRRRRDVRARQAAARRDGHDDPSLRRRRHRHADEAREQLPGDHLVPAQRRGDRAVAAVRADAREDARRDPRHDGDQRPAQDRVAGEGAQGRHRARLHDRSRAQGSDADRRGRATRRRCRCRSPPSRARRSAPRAAAGYGGKDFSAMVDVLCDLAEIPQPRLQT